MERGKFSTTKSTETKPHFVLTNSLSIGIKAIIRLNEPLYSSKDFESNSLANFYRQWKSKLDMRIRISSLKHHCPP